MPIKAKFLIPCNKNASWEIPHKDEKVFFDWLCTLPGTFERIKEGTRSYGGIHVELGDNEHLRIYKNIAELITENQIRNFIDDDRQFESWVFSTSVKLVDDAIYNQILSREL